MKNKRALRFLAILIGIFLISTFAPSCSKSGGAAAQTLVYNLGSDPQTIDPTLNDAVDGGDVITACFEGLTRIGPNLTIIPGVATNWDISPDGLTYTFHLRKDAKWSDGKPVTAKDFDYSWRRALNPATAASYANYLFYIKNGEAYYNKKASAQDLGIKIIDDYTLQATLNSPTPYFTELCAFPVYMPERQDVVDKSPTGWATNVSTYIGNGPFKLTNWSHNDNIGLAKNDNYWNKAAVKLSSMTFVMITEASSALTSFERGDIEYFDSPPATDTPRLISSGEATVTPEYGTYMVYLNTKKAPFNNANFRKALAYSINRTEIINATLKGGQKPAGAYVPFGSFDADKKTDFRTVGGNYYNPDGDVALAKKLLAQSGHTNGKGIPTLAYLYNTSEAHKAIAESLQDMWKRNLGINISLANQEWAVFQVTRKAGNYQMARGAWIGDYMDPMTFLEMWTTGNGNNDVRYSNPKYDSTIAAAKAETDITKRMKLLHDAEGILMNDMPIIPIYFYVSVSCIKPYIKGIYKTGTGTAYFDTAYIDTAAKSKFKNKS